jgi:putative protease
LNEEREKGRYYPLEEANGKTYILNSRDLCTIKILPEIIETGVQALKIEGRNKGIHYISVVTRVYREAIDTYYRQGRRCRFKTQWERDLKSVSNRGYTTGFLKELEYQKARQHYAEEGYRRDTALAGIIKEVLPGKRAVVDIKNDFSVDMRVSLFSPEKGSYLEDIRVISMESVDGKRESLVHTNRVVIMEFPHKVSAGSLIRVKNDRTER